ncbi:hypothetical protein [Engelhardtia mirabilis]|uniref:Uncharacterized protein n=1 Tax=Engelhardtia mirabilis TaxID=2528011 RepID=A0A518BNY8_9BACT|nr:hypothetical protein Pla133_37970 [Planctomycetes bacterium Pla133]QDV03021.1 hypothetical protein Pla86_37960 [Planctomycetes bacterium Pla86]
MFNDQSRRPAEQLRGFLRPLVALSPIAALVGACFCALGSTAAAQNYDAQINYDQSAQPSDPDYEETLANLWYPAAKGLPALGFPVEPLPVMVSVRGGNTNNITVGTGNPDELTNLSNDFGFLHVDCNYPLVGPTEDYHVASAGLGLMIQWLRGNAAEYNINPEQIFIQSRSFGTIAMYPVALREDFAVPGSADPVLVQSSRPDYYIPRLGPSTLTCFSTQAGPWDSTMSVFFFPGQTFDQGTPEQRLEESAYWSLLNPHLYDRQRTPPMCVVYKAAHTDVCGQVTDVHSGLFGDVMLEAIEDFVELTGDREFGQRSSSIDISSMPDATGAIVAWAVKRLAADFDGLWLVPPTGMVGSTGGDISLTVFGAKAGATLAYYTGTTAGTFPMPGCPNLEGQITDFTLLGTAPASPAGVGTWTFPVDASSVGQTALFHVVDFGNCVMSNVSSHVYF